MEALCVLAVALLAWVVPFTLLGGTLPRPHGSGGAARKARRALEPLLLALGRGRLVRLLLRNESWEGASRAVAARVSLADGLTDDEGGCVLLVAGTAVLAALLSLASRSLAGLPVAVALVGSSVPAWWASKRRERRRELSRAMPGVFRTLAMAMGSGETLSQAVSYLGSHERGAAGEAFSRASLRLSCGESVEEVMAALPRELDAPGVALLATSLAISQRTGSPLRGLFEYSARLVERQGEFERLLMVKTAQVRLSVRIVCAMPIAMILTLSLISPDFQRGLTQPVGIASVAIAALMDLAALAIIRRLMRGVL